MKNELENYLRNNLDKLNRQKPAPAVLDRVLAEMNGNKNDAPAGIVIPYRLLKWAAAAMVVITGGLVWWLLSRHEPQKAIVQTVRPGPSAIPPPQADSAVHGVVDAADQKIVVPARKRTDKATLKQKLPLAGLYNMQSAAGRINAIATTSRLTSYDNEVITVLLQILDTDPNTNVRLTALDGLSRFYGLPQVKSRLVASLKKQHDPVVQINLITLLTQIREARILPSLEQLVRDEKTEQSVKDIAWTGILKLRAEMIN